MKDIVRYNRDGEKEKQYDVRCVYVVVVVMVCASDVGGEGNK